MHYGILDSELLSSSYIFYRRDRHRDLLNAPVGGGVLTAVHARFTSSVVTLVDASDLECVFVRINLDGRNLYIGNFYIPPGSRVSTYENVVKVLKNISDLCAPLDLVVVVGDFNLPHLDWIPSDSDDFFVPSDVQREVEYTIVENFCGLGLHQVNGVFNHRQRLLDLVFTLEPSSTCVDHCLDPITNAVPDHPALHISISNCSHPSDIFASNFFRNFRKANFYDLNFFLSNADWQAVYKAQNIHMASDKLRNSS